MANLLFLGLRDTTERTFHSQFKWAAKHLQIHEDEEHWHNEAEKLHF